MLDRAATTGSGGGTTSGVILLEPGSLTFQPVSECPIPERPFGLFFLPFLGIASEPGIGRIYFIEKFVSLIVLNGLIKNGLHRLTFLL